MSKENEKKKNETISREQIVLWAYEAGFPTNYARNEIARFEKFARLVQRYLERDYKWKKQKHLAYSWQRLCTVVCALVTTLLH